MERDKQKLVQAFTLLLEGLGIDASTEDHFKDTPHRAADAWWEELCAGITKSPPKITMFPSTGDAQMILLRDIPVKSMCAHHLLPFIGQAHVAYIPGRGEIMGLSKLSRIVNFFARRPQVQENLTNQIADFIWTRIKGPQLEGGVGVLVRANHMCMCTRGVNHEGDMVTSALRGIFTQPEVRAEFMQLARWSR